MNLPEIRDKHGQMMNSCKLETWIGFEIWSRAHSTHLFWVSSFSMVSQLLTVISHFRVALEAGAFCLSLQALCLRQVSVHYRLTGREHCPPAIHKQPMKTAGFGKGCPFRLTSESWMKKSENWSGSLWVWLLTQWLTKLQCFIERGIVLKVLLHHIFQERQFLALRLSWTIKKVSSVCWMTTDSREISASSKAQGRK